MNHGIVALPSSVSIADEGARREWEYALPFLWEAYYKSVGMVGRGSLQSDDRSQPCRGFSKGFWSMASADESFFGHCHDRLSIGFGTGRSVGRNGKCSEGVIVHEGSAVADNENCAGSVNGSHSFREGGKDRAVGVCQRKQLGFGQRSGSVVGLKYFPDDHAVRSLSFVVEEEREVDVGVVNDEKVQEQFGRGDEVKGCESSLKPFRGKNFIKNQKKKQRRRSRSMEFVELAQRTVSDCSVGTYGYKGPNHARNVANRAVRKEKRKKNEKSVDDRKDGLRGHFSDLPVEEQKTLKNSYAVRLRAENELKSFRAEQQLKLEKAKDFSQLVKRQDTQIMRQTELNKVQVEKAFAQLSRTGNVPGVIGRACTVVSAGSSSVLSGSDGIGGGTISPNSSVSAAEVRALQQSELDKTHEVEKLRARLDKLKVVAPQMYSDLGFDRELPPTVGTGVTLDADGNPLLPNFSDICSDAFAYDGYVGEDGRFHFGENPAIYDA